MVIVSNIILIQVKARQDAKEKRWKEEDEKRKANSPLLLLQKANIKIEELERQLASSTEIREAEKKILIQEIAKNTELKKQIKYLEEEVRSYSFIKED